MNDSRAIVLLIKHDARLLSPPASPCSFSTFVPCVIPRLISHGRNVCPFLPDGCFLIRRLDGVSSGDLPAEKKRGAENSVCHRNFSQGLGNGFHLQWLPACKGTKKKESSIAPPLFTFVHDVLETHASTAGLENAKEEKENARLTILICVLNALLERRIHSRLRASSERRDKQFDIFYQR